jgi:hypothetical protein
VIVTSPPEPDFSHKRNVPWKLILWTMALVSCFGCCLACLLPVFAGARDSSKNAVCMINLRQSSEGMIQYTADHDDRFPPASHWMDLTRQYVDRDVFRCPVLQDKDPQAYGYAMDVRMSGKRQADVEILSRTPLLFESILTYRNAHGPFGGFPNPPRHGPTNRVAFADGSVRPLTPGAAAKLGPVGKEKRP